ncbi:sensor histidine kinase [Actinosynnema sp.]|uniref:sensor histidine kinase n=1 Tax=Actinosynnema sp. TaxID=1872144 RepID=UPI003F85FC4A
MPSATAVRFGDGGFGAERFGGEGFGSEGFGAWGARAAAGRAGALRGWGARARVGLLARWAALRALVGPRGHLVLDVAAVAVAALDVWLRVLPEAEGYSRVLSGVAVLAVVFRRRCPFLVVLLTIPGFLFGWSQLAAMIALGTLAWLRPRSAQTAVGAGLVWFSRFFLWPVEEFLALPWTAHVHDAIYGGIVAGMPVAIGLLAHVRAELSARVRELAAGRERERALHARAVRADERARLAREMHDVVSHQVSLIAVQAGALRVTVRDPDAKQVAGNIRMLSTRTLNELRELVSVLRAADEPPQPGVADLPQLLLGTDVSLRVDGPVRDLPAPVSGAVYRTVQEALTNVRKHAEGASAAVVVVSDGERVSAEVRNGAPPDRGGAGLPSGCHGLVGLRERAALLRGRFHAGPTDDGGFVVRVDFPLDAGCGGTGEAGSGEAAAGSDPVGAAGRG